MATHARRWDRLHTVSQKAFERALKRFKQPGGVQFREESPEELLFARVKKHGCLLLVRSKKLKVKTPRDALVRQLRRVHRQNPVLVFKIATRNANLRAHEPAVILQQEQVAMVNCLSQLKEAQRGRST